MEQEKIVYKQKTKMRKIGPSNLCPFWFKTNNKKVIISAKLILKIKYYVPIVKYF